MAYIRCRRIMETDKFVIKEPDFGGICYNPKRRLFLRIGGIIMRKISLLLLIAASLFCISFLASCTEPVTPVAYLRINTTGDQVAYYSSSAYSEQMKVYKNQAEFDDPYGVADITLQFGKCLGRDVLNDVAYGLVDLSDKPVYMTAYVSSETYSPSKGFYLNGSAIVPDEVDTSGVLIMYSFNDLDLIRTNPNGHIDSEAVNVLEYR